MKKTIYSLLLIAASCSEKKEELSLEQQIAKGKWIDLSYSFSNETLYWPTAENFHLDTSFVGVTPAGFYYEAYSFCAAEHGGTHLDAPAHFAKDKWATDEIPLDKLTGEAVVIDVSVNALKDPDYQISITDIEAWEKTNDTIPGDAILLFRTGYSSYYPDAKKYLGTDERGAAAVSKLHFPGIHPDAASWLVANRKIKAVGIDVASIDYGQSTDFKTHQLLYKENIPGFENIANLDKLPVKGSYIIALPMKIKNGSGGPLRIAAWMKN